MPRSEQARRDERGLPPVDHGTRGVRHWLARRLRFLADRIHPASAMRALGGIPGYSFTYERCDHGTVTLAFREDGLGTKLWYLGEERDRSWEEADTDFWPEGWERR
jgi:hypothetical protein